MADSPRIEELKRRVRSDPASIAFAALAEEYRRAGRFEDAIETCTAGLIRHPSYLSAHVTLGRALIEVGRLEDARNELEYVLRLAPENLAAIRGLAEIHDRLGEGPHEPAAKSQPHHEPAAPAMTVAEIHAASGFIRPAAENTEPAPSFAPPPAEPEPVKPQPPFDFAQGRPFDFAQGRPSDFAQGRPSDFAQGRPFDSGDTTVGSGLGPWETEAFTSPLTFPWEAQPATPPAPPSFDSRETTAPSELAPWEAEPAASPVPPAWEAEPATTPAEPFAPSIAPALEAEPASSYFVISMEEAAAPEAPPALESLSQVEQTPDEPAPRPFDSAQDRSVAQDMPFDSAQDRSFDSAQDMPSGSAQGRPDRSRATGLEDFLKAILRARAQRDAFR